ncbi:unnamed protein product [Linum tenue]|uniref:Uncharacterized protein n=1 Tax=Linum tenue TaxID=586396 RepID=A0AAV0IVZ9_9ROSI|nr:unnamed protein product [Linum tenue]
MEGGASTAAAMPTSSAAPIAASAVLRTRRLRGFGEEHCRASCGERHSRGLCFLRYCFFLVYLSPSVTQRLLFSPALAYSGHFSKVF